MTQFRNAVAHARSPRTKFRELLADADLEAPADADLHAALDILTEGPPHD